MRIQLEKGKQKELVLKAKGTKTWKEVAKKLGVGEQYLYRELKNEVRLLPEKVYCELCNLANENFDKFIIDKRENNWGQSKGGKNSEGSTKMLPKIKFDWELAEFIGTVLGDGHIEYNRKKGVYHIRIAGDLTKDKDYHTIYLKNLAGRLFNLRAREISRPKNNERFLDLYSINLIKLFISMGINPGNKIENQSTIPKWVWQDKSFVRACIRGLIDTDGSIHRMSKKDPNLLRISFKNYNKTLLEDTRKALITVGFNPSKIISEKSIYLSRQDEIRKYLKEIGFSNNKHKERLEKFNTAS